MKRLALILLLSTAAAAHALEEVDASFAKGVLLLRKSMADPPELVTAIKVLSATAGWYEKLGDDPMAATSKACLYWARKRLSAADAEALQKEPGVGERLESVAKSLPPEEAAALLQKADSFARDHGDNQLLVAIRFFEVADRFPESEEGRKALPLSRAAMQKATAKPKPAEYKPAAADGKALIQTDPPGASIILVLGETRIDLGRKTPATVQLPNGSQWLELELKGFRTERLDVIVEQKALAKPNLVKFLPLSGYVEIVFEPGWTIFVDGADTGRVTPATLDLLAGPHEIGLARVGLRDVVQRETVKNLEKITLEPKPKPQPGPSTLLQAAAAKIKEEMRLLVGKWEARNQAWYSIVDLKADGTFLTQTEKLTGKWKLELSTLVLTFDKHPEERLERVDKNKFGKAIFTLTRK